MRITEIGTYELTEESHIRFNSTHVGTCRKGMIFNVTQLNLENFQFYSPEMGDWQHYYFPARKAVKPGDRVRELHCGHRSDATGTVVSYKNGCVTYKTDKPCGDFIFAHVDLSDVELLPNVEITGPASGSGASSG